MCLWQDVYIGEGMYEVVKTFCTEASLCMRLPITVLVNRLVPAARVEESGRTHDAADHQVETLFLAGTGCTAECGHQPEVQVDTRIPPC